MHPGQPWQLWSVKSTLHFGAASLEGTAFGLTEGACYCPGFPPSILSDEVQC